MTKLIKISEGKSPFFYAALEEWLVRNADSKDTDYLLLYENKYCAVVGKNQCVYKELHFNFWYQQPEKVVRRVSGGGTVFHDSGNLNFAFISKFEENKVNNYALFNEPVRKYLESKNIPATFNERNDITANGKKISGNAQFTNRKNIISHGTLLINSNLELLGEALQKNNFEVATKAVNSVRSSVANLSSFNPNVNQVGLVKKELEQWICSDFLLLNEAQMQEVETLQKQKYETYEWRFGRSPDCKIICNDFAIKVVNGNIDKITISNSAFNFLPDLVSLNFEKSHIEKTLSPTEHNLFLQALT